MPTKCAGSTPRKLQPGGKARNAIVLLSLLVSGADTMAQAYKMPGGLVTERNAEEAERLFELTDIIATLQHATQSAVCGQPALAAETAARVEFTQGVQAANLQVDSALAELNNERGKLSDLRASLQLRRDKTVGRFNTAALLTGSGIGAAVSATQFTTLPSTVQNTGDAVGIAAGVTSTVLTLIAQRKQAGPSGNVHDTPNMLAPLLGSPAAIQTPYPAAILQFLQSPPPDGDDGKGTRLELLRSAWAQSGRLGTGSAQDGATILALTSSDDLQAKVTIGDLTNRIAMLSDVSGRVSLLKRDLAYIADTYKPQKRACAVR